MALQEKPFACQHYQVEMSALMLQWRSWHALAENEENESQTGFVAPYPAGSRKRVTEECDLDRALLCFHRTEAESSAGYGK